MIFDGHTDILTDICIKRSQGNTGIFNKYHLPRFQKGGISGAVFVIWIDPPYDTEPKKRVWQILKSMHDELSETDTELKLIKSKEDFLKDTSKVNMILGMEGLSHVDESTGLDVLNAYYELGLRHASLTWNEANALATGVTQDPGRGLTELGKEAVKRLNDLGILVDVSHLNEKSFWDLAATTNRPFMATHSNAAAVHAHRRNLTDEQIKEIAKSGGLIGLNSYYEFVGDKEDRTVDMLAKHAAHIAGLVGVEHLALGFDFCDFLGHEAMSGFCDESNPDVEICTALSGLKDCSEVPNLLKSLSDIGFSNEDVEKVAYKNYIDFINKVWKY